MPHVFSSNMVLQRDQANLIWGWAAPGESVVLSIQNQRLEVKADEKGSWKVRLKPMAAGGPYSMTIQGKNTLRFENILVGDIWLCSGQSNMAWPVQLSTNGKEEVAQAGNPQIRILSVPQRLSLDPELNQEDSWQICSPETIADFSAVGYFFGRVLQDRLDVPIGLIDASWGGSMIEPWISAQGLQEVNDAYQKIQINKEKDQLAKLAALKKQLAEVAGFIPEKDPGFEEHWNRPAFDFSSWKKIQVPQVWEKAGLKDLDGIVWFQKEFELSSEQAKSEVVMLELGPLDDSDMTFFNGPLIGKTHGEWAKARVYEVPSYVLRSGRNVVVVRVEDTGGDGGFRGEPEQVKLKGPEWVLPLAGEWRFKIGEFKSDIRPNDFPSGLFNAMIHPLIPFGIKGAIWYQGESNVNNGYQYRKLMPMMIEDWRARWQQGDFPFLMVQLANFGEHLQEPGSSKWAELREAQFLTALHHPNTSMAVTIDIGEGNDIHPRNKQDVGKRLALQALANTYGREIIYSGPVYKRHQVEQGRIRVFFDHTAAGLTAADGSKNLKGFSIAGPEGTFRWAEAYIDQNSVVVYNPEVKNSKNVRYGWEDNPEEVNLFNSAGLPASPFRTDVPK